MTGHHGYISEFIWQETVSLPVLIRLPECNSPALVNTFFGPVITPVLARLQKEH